MLFQSDQINDTEISATLDLMPGTYNILASTYLPNLEGSYRISVSGNSLKDPRDFYEITPDKDWKYTIINGQWRNGKDGGCSDNVSTFSQNPEFLITCPKQQLLRIMVETESETIIGFYIYKTNDGTQISEALPNSHFARGASIGRVTVFKDYPEISAGKYILRPTTYNPRVHAKFTVQILAESAACQISERT